MILCIVMVISMLPVGALAAGADNLRNFTKRNTYTNNTFDDVEKSDWFYENVKSVYELGLMQGKGDNKFDTESGITIAETLTIAARLHSIYYTGTDTFKASNPWYQVYADYCAANGIASVNSDSYSQTATRAEFVMILANALPVEVFAEINKVAANAIPDVTINDTYGAAVYKMYRAGIMIGNDDIGTFSPSSEIRRSEVATIVTRMVDISLRKPIQLGNEYTVTFNMNGQGKQIDSQTVVEGYAAEKPADPTKPTYVFKGWYTQKSGGQQFDFNTPITKDITLYARWEIDPLWLALMMGWMNNQNNNNDTQTYTVTFDANGSGVTNLPTTQTVKAGECATLPLEPSRAGYIFTGWYLDNDEILAWDYRKPINNSITVYAGWKEYGITTSNESVLYQISDISINTTTSKIYTELSTDDSCYLSISVTSEDQLTLLFEDTYAVNASLEYYNFESGYNVVLPQYFVVFATLIDEFGNKLSNQYVYIEHTKAYEEFNNKTISDFESDKVISFDGSFDNNFAVSSDDVEILNISSESTITKENNKYIFAGNVTDLPLMSIGSRYIICHNNNNIYLINVIDIEEQSGQIIITTDEVAIADFFDYIKINSSTRVTQEDVESVNTVSAAFYSLRAAATPELGVGEKISLSTKFKDPDEIVEISLTFEGVIDNTFELWYGIEWKTIWYIPYPAPYFHLKEIVEIDSGITFDISLSNPSAPSAKTPFFEQKVAKVKVPVLPAVNVEFELFIPMEINVESSLKIDVKYKQRAGFIYDLGSDLVKINECEKSLEDTTQINGKVSVDVGVKLKGGFTLIEVLDLYLFAKAGFIVEGNANIIDFDAATKDSQHMCTLCLDCKANFYAELGAGATVCVEIKGWEIFDTGIEGSIPVAFSPIGDFYCSILNPQNSIHKGNFTFDWGDCPNIAWKTTFMTTNSSNVTTNDSVNVHNNRSDSVSLVCNGNSVFSEFLYNGSYIAKSTIDGTEYTQTFRVDDAPQTVTIKASNGGSSTDPDQPGDDDPIIPIIPPVETGYTVSGRLVSATDETPIANMSVSLTNNSNFYTVTTDSNGSFEFTNVVAAPVYALESGDGVTFDFYIDTDVTVSGNTNLGDIKLIEIVSFAGGTGTSVDPYQISTPSQLNAIRRDLSAHYILINNIDMSTSGKWVPVGTLTNPFTGSLNGSNYAINKIQIDDVTTNNVQCAGLFGVTNGATIKNLSINDASVNLNGASENLVTYSSGLVAYNTANDITILNCNVDAIIHHVTTSTDYRTYAYSGGVIGKSDSPNTSISQSSVSGEITLNLGKTYRGNSTTERGGTAYTGGGVGWTYALSVSNFEFNGDIKSYYNECANTGYMGGVASYCTSITASDISVEGNISVLTRTEEWISDKTTKYFIGGIAGSCGNYNIDSANIKSNITCNGEYSTGNYIGGILGAAATGTVLDTHYNGSITSKASSIGSDPSIGGLIGRSNGNADIQKSSSICDINTRGYSSGEIYSGGFIGIAESLVTINDCNISVTIFATAYNSADPRVYSGGAVGYASDALNLTKCTISGTMTTDENCISSPSYSKIGGIVGCCWSASENLIYDSDTTFNTSYPANGIDY